MRVKNIKFDRLTVIILPLILCAAGFAKIIYVDDDASGANNGSSWENAYTYLQDALADANDSGKPVEIRVAQGIYKPDQGAEIAAGDRNATFRLINDVTIKGGYAGVTAPDPNARDIELYETILSGDLADNDTPINNPELLREEPPSRKDNSLYIVKVQKSNQSTEIDGFVISSGSNAGLYAASKTDIIVRDCLFTSNVCPGMTSFAFNSVIENCIFRDNKNIFGEGGGIIIGGYSRIYKCTFDNNYAREGGGLYGGGCLWLEDCIFTHNIASGLRYADTGSGGGLCIPSFQENSKIINCIFIDNIASQGGGAQIGYSGMVPTSRQDKIFSLSGCTFIRNQASSGGAIAQSRSCIDIYSCIFLNNSAMFHSGGAVSTVNSNTKIASCFFSGNYALERGASLYASGSEGNGGRGKPMTFDFTLMLNNCTFTGNFSPSGRSLHCKSYGTEDLDRTFITNCILDNGGDEIRNPDGSKITIDYTNLRGGINSVRDPNNAIIWGKGNIDVDPLFADSGYWTNLDDPNTVTIQWDSNWEPIEPNAVWTDGDYRLKSQAGRWDPNNESWVIDDVTSSCIDAGDPNSPVGDEPEPNGGRINMGAYGGTAEASKSR